jgi:negative regulator of sigma E activity
MMNLTKRNKAILATAGSGVSIAALVCVSYASPQSSTIDKSDAGIFRQIPGDKNIDPGIFRKLNPPAPLDKGMILDILPRLKQ